jgi:hypothetical protein
MSAAPIAIAGGTEISHCSATGSLPGGESSAAENTPGVFRSVRDGGTCKDWPNTIAEEIDIEIAQLAKDIVPGGPWKRARSGAAEHFSHLRAHTR